MAKAGSARLLAVAAVLASMASFQTGASLAKALFPTFGALGTVGLRVGLAALMLCALWRPWRTAPSAPALRAALLFGAALGLMNACFYQAIARLPLGITVAIESLGPLAVALAGSRRRLDLVWIGLVLAGLALLLATPAALPALDPVGLLFAVLAAAGWAAYIVFGVRLGRVMPTGPAIATGMLVAACLVVPAGLNRMAPLLSAPAWLPLAAVVALLSSALPHTLELAAMRHLRMGGFGILMSLEPAVAALAGLLLLGEHLAVERWLGILCVVTASAGSVLVGGSEQGWAADFLSNRSLKAKALSGVPEGRASGLPKPQPESQTASPPPPVPPTPSPPPTRPAGRQDAS